MKSQVGNHAGAGGTGQDDVYFVSKAKLCVGLCRVENEEGVF